MHQRNLRITFFTIRGVAAACLLAGVVCGEDNIESSQPLLTGALAADPAPSAETSPLNVSPRTGVIGVALRIEDGKIFVGKVLPDTPAAQSGIIKINDQVVAVAEGSGRPTELVDVKDVAKVVEMIRGPIGSSIRISLVPSGKGTDEQIVVNLVREDVTHINTFVDGGLPIGSEAPNFKFEPLAHCKETELAQLRGHIVVVEFWASWCGPCVKSLSDFDSLQASHPEWDKAVSIVSVGVDFTKEKATALLSKNNWSHLSIVWAGPEVLDRYRVGGLPTVYVLDQAGKVVAVDHHLDVPQVIKPLLEKSN